MLSRDISVKRKRMRRFMHFKNRFTKPPSYICNDASAATMDTLISGIQILTLENPKMLADRRYSGLDRYPGYRYNDEDKRGFESNVMCVINERIEVRSVIIKCSEIYFSHIKNLKYNSMLPDDSLRVQSYFPFNNRWESTVIQYFKCPLPRQYGGINGVIWQDGFYHIGYEESPKYREYMKRCYSGKYLNYANYESYGESYLAYSAIFRFPMYGECHPSFNFQPDGE